MGWVRPRSDEGRAGTGTAAVQKAKTPREAARGVFRDSVTKLSNETRDWSGVGPQKTPCLGRGAPLDSPPAGSRSAYSSGAGAELPHISRRLLGRPATWQLRRDPCRIRGSR